MRRAPERRPVFKALHQPLSIGIAGLRIDYRFVFLAGSAGVIGVVWFSMAFGITAGLLMLAAGIATRHDPQMLPILWRAQFLRARYDPLKHERFTIVVIDDATP